MIYALNNVFLLYLFECLLYHCLMAVLDQTDHLLGPERLEVPLDHGEDRLDRVVVRLVRAVIDEPEAMIPHHLLRVLR